MDHGGLAVSGGEAATLFQPPGVPIDEVVTPVLLLVESLSRLIRPCRDHGFDAASGQPLSDPW